tara:strand:+ start:1981 stop:2181 length:201 start_codon:yes stop_codon:yes gene_type:complete
MNEIYKVGDLVEIKALPGISMATLFDGKVGVIARRPSDGDISFEVYVDDRTLWLIPGEMILIESKE